MSALIASIDTIPDSVSIAITILLVLALCALSNRRNHASPGPDSEELSGVRPGASPTEAPVVSGGTHLRLEQAPACDRASDLLSDINPTASGLSRRVEVRSTAAGAPAVSIYRWVRPAEGKKLLDRNWWLEHVDPRYGTWLVKKEERWP